MKVGEALIKFCLFLHFSPATTWLTFLKLSANIPEKLIIWKEDIVGSQM